MSTETVLTDEQIDATLESLDCLFWDVSEGATHDFARAIEQAVLQSPEVQAWMEAYATEKVREEQQWQPIETAPKDGTMILLGRPADESQDLDAVSVPGFWQEGWEDSIDDMGCDSGFVDVNFQKFNGGRGFGAEKYRYAPTQPTHWMPLPAPPQQ